MRRGWRVEREWSMCRELRMGIEWIVGIVDSGERGEWAEWRMGREWRIGRGIGE